MHHKPLVVLDPDGVYELLRAQIDDLVLRGFARPAVRDSIAWTTTVNAAFDALELNVPRLLPTAAEVLEAEP
jgi:hypothetical protein